MQLRIPVISKFKMRRPAGWVVACALTAPVAMAVAVQDSASQQPTQSADCANFGAAVVNAMQVQEKIVDVYMTTAITSMQDAVSTKNSCIGNIALLDIDLSNLIPDFGMLGSILQSAIDRLVTGVINKVCAAARQAIAPAVTTWNSTVSTVNGELNLNGQVQAWGQDLSYSVNQSVDKLVAGIGPSGSAASPVVPTAPVVVPVTCYQTMTGKICSDGSTQGGASSSLSVGPSGAYIGANLMKLASACTAAITALNNGQKNATQADVDSACGALQTFINPNAPYLTPQQIPVIPGYPIVIPSNLGGRSEEHTSELQSR